MSILIHYNRIIIYKRQSFQIGPEGDKACQKIPKHFSEKSFLSPILTAVRPSKFLAEKKPAEIGISEVLLLIEAFLIVGDK